MSYIAGSDEFLREHCYSVIRKGPLLYVAMDDDSGEEVCRGKTHAEVVRALLAARFPGDLSRVEGEDVATSSPES